MLNENETIVLKATTRLKKKEGELFLTNQRLIWTTGDGRGGDTKDVVVSVAFSRIKAQFVNQVSEAGRVMLKITLHEQDSEYLFLFTSEGEKALKEREAIKDALAQILGRIKGQQSITSTTTQEETKKPPQLGPSTLSVTRTSPSIEPLLTKEDLKVRATLLAKNKDLQRLHRELVFPGHLTEEEFWETRRQLLVSHDTQIKQKKGLPSSLLADIRPTTDTSSSDIKYTLTPAIIHSIFLQYPQVHRIYQQNVPDKLSEKEFWTKYFQSKFFHRDRLLAKDLKEASQEKDLFSSCLTEVAHARKERGDVNVSPLINLSVSSEEEEDSTHDTMGRESSGLGVQSLVEKLNRHGNLILKSSTRQKEKSDQERHPIDSYETSNSALHDAIKYDDLELQHTETFDILEIQDTKKYFEIHSTTVRNSNSDLGQENLRKIGVADESLNYMTSFRPRDQKLQRNKCFPSEEYRHIWNPSVSELSSYQYQNKETLFDHSVSPTIKQDLNTLYSNLIEILRHFWATIPPTDPERISKHTRMIHTLQLLKQKLEGFRKSCERESPETREQIQFILNSMSKSIEKALLHGSSSSS